MPFMFLVCNGSDLCGRLVAGVGPWSTAPPPMLLLVVYSLLRIPLSLPLLFCQHHHAHPLDPARPIQVPNTSFLL